MREFLSRQIIRTFESGIKRRKTFRYWNELERTQWLSRDELADIQFRALQQLLIHASETCPYYQETWKRLGIDIHDIKSLSDFQQLPTIDRDTIRENRLRMRAQKPRLRLISKSTGGSSGTPLHFDLDLNSNDRRMAAWHRGYTWAGARLGTKQLYLWGVPLTPLPRRKQLKDQFYAHMYGRTTLNTFGLSDSTLAEYHRRLNEVRPDVIVAYTNSVYEFARMLDERQLKPWRPKSIVVGAEKLHPFQRERIERVFGAPVFETYGSREFMLMGAECERHDGLHLTTEQLLIEIIDDDGCPTPTGKEGNVAVTDLYNYGMPFIRYLNGDRALAGTGACSCGRGLSMLKEVVGRQTDTLHTPDGRHVSGCLFPHLMKDFAAIKRFMVVQPALDLLQLHVVVSADWNADSQARMEQSVRSVMGPMVQVKTKVVDQIPLTLAGKQRVVVNLCGSDNAPVEDSRATRLEQTSAPEFASSHV
jgi:phenylacetate-CoA ligase